jgi:hypothetical protein
VTPRFQLDLVDVDDVLRPWRRLTDDERRHPGLDVPRIVSPALDPRPAEPHRSGAGQPAELRPKVGREHQVLESLRPADERVLALVRAVDHTIAGPHLVDRVVLPGKT